MFCAKCGAPMEEGQYFCPQCWTVVTEIEAEEAAEKTRSSAKKIEFKKVFIGLAILLGIGIMVAEAFIIRAIWGKSSQPVDMTSSLKKLFQTYSDAINHNDEALYREAVRINEDDLTELVIVTSQSAEDWKNILYDEMKMENKDINHLDYTIVGWYQESEDTFIVSTELTYEAFSKPMEKQVDYKVQEQDGNLYIAEWVSIKDMSPETKEKRVQSMYKNMCGAINQNNTADFIDACGFTIDNGSFVEAEKMDEVYFVDSLDVYVRSCTCLSYVDSSLKHYKAYEEVIEVDAIYTYQTKFDDRYLTFDSYSVDLINASILHNEAYALYDIPDFLSDSTLYDLDLIREFEERALEAIQDAEINGPHDADMKLFYQDEYFNELYEYDINYVSVSGATDSVMLQAVYDFHVTNSDSPYYREGIERYYSCICEFMNEDQSICLDVLFVLGKVDGKYYIIQERSY